MHPATTFAIEHVIRLLNDDWEEIEVPLLAKLEYAANDRKVREQSRAAKGIGQLVKVVR